MLDNQTLAQFSKKFSGELISPEQPNYDEARALYNAMIDRRPQLIARCTSDDDVREALRFARERELRVAIRGGGHNGAGFGSCDDGLVIDLSQRRTVQVEPAQRTVRAESGCTQADVDQACHRFGLAVPAGIVSTTGIAGLTLGGGHGYLSRAYGLTIDNLLEADVVLADGRSVTANEREHSDLFWALRGGGGNFGVVTRFHYRAQPVSQVYGGPIFWPIERAQEVMRFYREFLPTAPERLCPFLGLKTVPSCPPFPESIWGRRICAIISCYDGAEEEGIAAMRPIREALPEPLLDGMGMMPFPAMQSLFDGLLPKGLQWYWNGDFVKSLPDEAIAMHIEHAARSPSPLSLMHLYPIDGAVQRVGTSETAWSHRDATWSMVIAGIDPDPGKAGALVEWGRRYWSAVHAFNPGGAYVNFMSADGGEARVKAAYGVNYERLVSVKRQYDPHNVFRVNHNIPPKH